MAKLEEKEASRILNIYSDKSENFKILESKGIRPTERMLKREKETTVLIPHFEERPAGHYEVDRLLYLSTSMGN